MLITQTYNSAAERNSARKKQNNSVSPFAQATFDAFEQFINVFDAGANFFGPYHTISKESWGLYLRQKQGEKPLFYADGTKFNPYNHVLRNIYSPEHVQHHMTDNEKSYYTSGRNGLGMYYLDVDAHHKWQTDELRARELLERLFPQAYYRPSTRGQNGYLKIRYSSISDFNEIAVQLELSLKQLFLDHEILCDIEVKGKITHEGKSGSLAKLPFSTDVWNGQQLELFKSCPIINNRRVERIARQISKQIDPDKVAQFSAKKQKIQEWSDSRAKIIKVFRDHGYRGTDDEVFAKAKMVRDQQKQNPNLNQVASVEPPKPIGITEEAKTVLVASPSISAIFSTKQGSSQGDAFKRNLEDLPPFVRSFYKKHQTLPTVDDALTFLHDSGLYSGDWSDNESGRAKRVSQILETIKKTFDPKLLRSGESKPVELSLAKFDWWVRRHIGSGMTGEVANLREFDPVLMTAPIQKVSIPARFVNTFLAVINFCLNEDPLVNKAVPTNRIKKIWTKVVGGASWNQTYFQIVRDRLERMGVVHIFDRHHEANKAWRWDAGTNFPSETWKSPKVKLFVISYQDFIANTNIVMDEQVLNTLYQSFYRFVGIEDRKPDIRPPPT